MPTCLNNIVRPQILTFQARYAAVLNHRRTRTVRPAQNPWQDKLLNEIWHVGRLGEQLPFDRDSHVETINGVDGDETPRRRSVVGGRSMDGWRKLGLTTDGDDEDTSVLAEVELFRHVGELGLECLVSGITPDRQNSADPTALVCNARGQLPRCELASVTLESEG